MTFMVATHRLDIQKGICWEAYVIWASVMLSRAILQAAYFTISLPAESYVPEFGKPVIEGILPIVGETLDIFKDWMFVGIAVHTQTLLGCMFCVRWTGDTAALECLAALVPRRSLGKLFASCARRLQDNKGALLREAYIASKAGHCTYRRFAPSCYAVSLCSFLSVAVRPSFCLSGSA